MRRENLGNSFYNPPINTVLISDPLVTQIPLKECDEELVDLEIGSLFKIDNRLADNDGKYRLVRIGLAERLYKAAEHLPEGLCFLIVEGFRPLSLQAQYFNEYFSDLRHQHPSATEQETRTLTSRYVAPPDQLPPHCTGAAVDLSLAYRDGPELDMGTSVNASPEQSGDRCYTNSPNISKGARTNRKLLCKALETAGLVNYPTEWWHWSYGDRYWSLKTGSSMAIYGFIET